MQELLEMDKEEHIADTILKIFKEASLSMLQSEKFVDGLEKYNFELIHKNQRQLKSSLYREERIQALSKLLNDKDENSNLINFRDHEVNWNKIAEIADAFYNDPPKLIREGEL